MSQYYYFYLGYKKDNVFHGVGPYGIDKDGKYYLHSVLCRSDYNVTGLKNCFWETQKPEEIGEDIKESIAKTYSFFSEEPFYRLLYMSLTELRELIGNSGLKSAYVTTDAVNSFELEEPSERLPFCQYIFEEISPTVYAKMSPEKQEKFIYYSWLDYDSKSYMANLLNQIVNEFLNCNSKAEFDKYDESNFYIFMKIE